MKLKSLEGSLFFVQLQEIYYREENHRLCLIAEVKLLCELEHHKESTNTIRNGHLDEEESLWKQLLSTLPTVSTH